MNHNRKSPAEVVEYLLNKPEGATSFELRELLCVGYGRCLDLLRRWRVAGDIAYAGSSPIGRWCHPKYAAALHAEIKEGVRQRRMGNIKAAKKRKAEEKPARIYAQIPAKRTIIKASEVKPIQKLGPNSVFELAR